MKEHLKILWTGLWRILIVAVIFVAMHALFVWQTLFAIVVFSFFAIIAAAYGLGVMIRSNEDYWAYRRRKDHLE